MRPSFILSIKLSAALALSIAPAVVAQTPHGLDDIAAKRVRAGAPFSAQVLATAGKTIAGAVLCGAPAAEAAEKKTAYPVNAGKRVALIPYGNSPECVAPPACIPTTRDVRVSASAFAVDPDGNILIVDAINGKVLSVAAGGGEVKRLFSYSKGPIGDNYVSDVAVAPDGRIYLADAEARKVYRYDQSGTLEASFGGAVDKVKFGRVGYIFTDDSSSVHVIDPIAGKMHIFDAEARHTREIAIAAAKEIAGVAPVAGPEGGLFFHSLRDNAFTIARADRPKEAVFRHTCDPREIGAKIISCALIGFDGAGNAYARASLIGEGRSEISTFLVKFSKNGGKEVLKMKIPRVPETAHAMKRPFAVLGENALASCIETEKGLSVVIFEF